MDELASLAETAGVEVVGRVTQRIDSPTPAYYLGEGKVREVAEAARQAQASLLLFDEDLSPVQGKNLETAVGVRVMDRSELILDIFASRARSNEAKLQVELAQLEYLLPRLARMWVHLSRIRGGIGLRGPGETQLETDRRMIRRKISTLKKKLAHVAQHREVIRRGRREILTAVLVGYTNAGKSSLLRALTGADTLIENRLFATLDTMTREMLLRTGNGEGGTGKGREAPESRSADGRRIRLIDTVGFIRKLPHHLIASFGATLEEARRADVLLHVIDVSHPDWEEQVEVVNRTLWELGVREAPVIHVFNKMDVVPEPDGLRATLRARYERAVCVSAAKGEVGEVAAELAARASAGAAPGGWLSRGRRPLGA